MQLPTAGDSRVAGGEQVRRERERVTNAEPKLGVQLVGKCQLQERVVRNASGDASPLSTYTGDGQVREQVVEPFVRDSNGKC